MSTIHLPEISNESGDVIELGSGNTYILDVYTDGDFDGTQNKHSLIKSDTYGSTVILDLSVVGNITVRYCDFSNINIINGTVTFIGGDNYNQSLPSEFNYLTGRENVSTYTINGYAYVSAVSEIATSAIPESYFTSGTNSGISSEQNYLWFLSGSAN
jgi:predicted butyrate kinase (DUF1464 family)